MTCHTETCLDACHRQRFNEKCRMDGGLAWTLHADYTGMEVQI
jgi:hypothetical protein